MQVLRGRPERRRSDGDGGRDPGAAPRRVHARQPAGGRRTASRARTGGRSRTPAVRRRQGLALQDDERDRAGRARRSPATHRRDDAGGQLATERSTPRSRRRCSNCCCCSNATSSSLLADLVRLRAKERGPGVWHAVLALCEPDDDERAADRARSAGAGRRRVLAVRGARRRGRRDVVRTAAIGAWCASRLDELGDRTITVGPRHGRDGFRRALRGPRPRRDRRASTPRAPASNARSRSPRRNGAALWEAHSTVELADVSLDRTTAHLLTEARRMLAELRGSPVMCASAPSRPPRHRGRPRRRRTLNDAARIGCAAVRGEMEHWRDGCTPR